MDSRLLNMMNDDALRLYKLQVHDLQDNFRCHINVAVTSNVGIPEECYAILWHGVPYLLHLNSQIDNDLREWVWSLCPIISPTCSMGEKTGGLAGESNTFPSRRARLGAVPLSGRALSCTNSTPPPPNQFCSWTATQVVSLHWALARHIWRPTETGRKWAANTL